MKLMLQSSTEERGVLKHLNSSCDHRLMPMFERER